MPRGQIIQTSLLNSTEREQLLANILRTPSQFVAQERVERSSVPVWSNGEVVPWRMGMRTFLMAQGHGYSVLPVAWCVSRKRIST